MNRYVVWLSRLVLCIASLLAWTAQATNNTVTYSGSKLGRIYINATTSDIPLPDSVGFATTSIDQPGSYSLNVGNTALSDGNSITVTAWMDVLNRGYYVSSDPIGSVTFTKSGALSVPEITLSEPSAPSGATTDFNMVVPFAGGAVVLFQPILDGSGVETATSYDISATPSGGGTTTTFNVPSGGQNFALLTGLTVNGTYDLAINGRYESTAWTSTPYSSSVTLSAGPGTGGIISGTVDLSAITIPSSNTSPLLLVVAMAASNGMPYVDAVPITSTSETFSISGLSDDDYYMMVIVDVDGNGAFDGNDVMAQGVVPPVTVFGGVSSSQSITAPAPLLPSTSVNVRGSTQRTIMLGDTGSGFGVVYDGWGTRLWVSSVDPAYLASATVNSGPGFSAAQDLTLVNMGNMTWTSLAAYQATSGTPSSQTFALSYRTDTSTRPLTTWPTSTSTTTSYSYTPTLLDPVSSPNISTSCVSSANVMEFSWSAPSSPPSVGYHYSVSVSESFSDGGAQLWHQEVSSSTFSVVYDGPALTDGDSYVIQFAVVDDNDNRADLMGEMPYTAPCSPWPDISSFLTTPSDQFLVDYANISAGHPFKGTRANTPHTGGHIHFDNSTNAWPSGGTAPSNYPPIYAVADGQITRVDTYFAAGSNYRYGLSLAFASIDNETVTFEYAIEPMIDPGNSSFYEPFLLVEEGDYVQKGDVIAYMYLPPSAPGDSHIHFHINRPSASTFLAPAIFDSTVASNFEAHYGWLGTDGFTPPGPSIPACLGYMLSAAENPYGTGAVDEL
jgi:hypothetical protein